MKHIEYVDRNCDVCGSGSLDQIMACTTKARTRSDSYLWKISNVVCRDCGFAFVSPAPSQESLVEYYTDCFPYFPGEAIEFSTENRLALLRRHIRPNSRPRFVEVGSNATDPFQQALSGLVSDYRSVELNNDCASDFASLQSLPPSSVDILGAYFVLEHVVNPGECLSLMARSLKQNGILVIEVPNLYIYPINPAGIVWYEHTNHFSPRTLAALAEANGLELVEISYQECSRPYGFAAVFSKSAQRREARPSPNNSEYQIAKACMTEGASLIQDYHAQLSEVREKIRWAAQAERPIVLWAANKFCIDLLEGMELPPSAVIVDDTPGKRDYLHPLTVHRPEEVNDSILRANLFVISSSLHSAEIVRKIRNKREVKDEEVVIIEPGFRFYKDITARSATAP